ncbi:MAG: hypothetical protein E7090_08085 [Bacteroidales bacterium]|nr:hypothetical protein [Bacteroidales bacterium]
MIEKYNAVKRIPSFDVDMSSTLRPVSFLNFAQEAANIHADYLGVGYDAMHITRKAWVLARMHVIFHKLPMWRDHVNIQSWHKGANGFQFFRDFVVFDKEGSEKLISATSTWLVIDIDTRRMSKYPEMSEDEGKCIKEDVIAQPAAKVVLPKDIEPVFVAKHPVNYSDLDMNGHVNNIKYTEWAMNSIELDVVNSMPVKELLINFNNEILPGDNVDIYRYREELQDGGLAYYIEGKVNGKSSFVEKLLF